MNELSIAYNDFSDVIKSLKTFSTRTADQRKA